MRARHPAASALLAALVAVASCSTEPLDPVVVAAENLLASFDPTEDPDGGFAALNRFVAEQPDLAADVAAGLVHVDDDHTRYAAVYVLALTVRTNDQAAALRAAYEDELPYVRALAAGSLIGLGDVSAIEELIELTTTTDEVLGSEPSLFVDRFASRTLTAYTGEDFGVLQARGSSEREAARERWLRWWERVRDDIRWDAGAGRYET